MSAEWKEVHVDTEGGLVAFGPGQEHRNSPFGIMAGSFAVGLFFFTTAFFDLVTESFKFFASTLLLQFLLCVVITWVIMNREYKYSFGAFICYSLIVYTIDLIWINNIYTTSLKLWGVCMVGLPILNLGLSMALSNRNVQGVVSRMFLELTGAVYKLDTKERYLITSARDTKEIYLPIIKQMPFKVSYELNSKSSQVKKIELLQTRYEKQGLTKFLQRYAYYVHIQLSRKLKDGETLTIIAQ